MPAALLDGRTIANTRRALLKQRLQQHLDAGAPPPGLAVILIGSDPASAIYVKNKRKACEEVGMLSHAYDLPENTSEEKLLVLIDTLNQTDHIDGILIQLPLPSHINEHAIIERICPAKDVDGFHPYNLGRLAQKYPALRPCTPLGIIHLLQAYQLPIQGKHALVIGASNIVGRPMSLELLLAGATVTVCHRFTEGLQAFVEQADIIIIATGIQDLVKADWLKQHHVIVDVGIHRLADGSIRGDIDFKAAASKVSWLTPVPGGVGPMAIVTLMENTLMAAEGRRLLA